jgi:single-stranded-DNA-specific exonuclease
MAHGSARSVEGFNIFEALCACSDDLVRFGGHPLAAGVTLKSENINAFRKHINEFAIAKYPTMPVQQLVLDCKLSPFYLTLDLVDNLTTLEPYGEGNPQAIFGIYKMTLVSVSPLKDGKHIRMELEKRGRKIRVVKFGEPYDKFPYHSGDVLNLAVKVSKNFFREKYYLSVQAVDVRLSSADDDKYFSEKNSYDLFKATGEGDSTIYPSREICAVIYNYLKKNGGYNYSVDDLYFRLQNSVTYAQLMFALDAFSEAGLILIDDKITINKVDGKVNLEETKTLSTLKGRLGIG